MWNGPSTPRWPQVPPAWAAASSPACPRESSPLARTAGSRDSGPAPLQGHLTLARSHLRMPGLRIGSHSRCRGAGLDRLSAGGHAVLPAADGRRETSQETSKRETS